MAADRASDSTTIHAGAPAVDLCSGFCAETGVFVSLRPAVALPSDAAGPLSFTSFAFSLLPNPLPSRPALIDATTGDAVSYPHLVLRVNALAAALRHDLGVAKRDVAFVLAPTRLDIPVLYLALLSVGAVVSPANPALTDTEIDRFVRLSRPSIAFTTSAMAEKLPTHLRTIAMDSPEFQSMMTLQGGRTQRESGDGDSAVWPSDPAAIQYSSGTSGKMKAALIPHLSFIAQAAGFHALRPRTARPRTTLLVGPMFHSMGFFFSLNGIALGESTVVMTTTPQPQDQKVSTEVVGGRINAVLRAAEQHQVTLMLVAPPLVVAIAKAEQSSAERSMRTVQVLLYGGAPLPMSAAAAFRARFPHTVLCSAYGSTEAGGIARMIGFTESARLGSTGRLSQNVEARVVDASTGKVLSVGQLGEFHVRGPSVMTCYVGDEMANKMVFTSDGWLKTGDLGYIDKDGFVFVVDRLKELIKYKGYQVPPAELEQLLQAMPGILDVAVAPYPDEYAGQIPMAFIVREPGSYISEAAIFDFIAGQVAPYKKIRKAVFVNAIPKSASGKILRRQLSDLLYDRSMSRI